MKIKILVLPLFLIMFSVTSVFSQSAKQLSNQMVEIENQFLTSNTDANAVSVIQTYKQTPKTNRAARIAARNSKVAYLSSISSQYKILASKLKASRIKNASKAKKMKKVRQIRR